LHTVPVFFKKHKKAMDPDLGLHVFQILDLYPEKIDGDPQPCKRAGLWSETGRFECATLPFGSGSTYVPVMRIRFKHLH